MNTATRESPVFTDDLMGDDADDKVIDLSQPNINFSGANALALMLGMEDLFQYEMVADVNAKDKEGNVIKNAPKVKYSLEYERFMQELVVAEIAETSDKYAPPAVFVGINGDERWLPRGMKFKIQRKFIERLAQSKEARFATVRNHDNEVDNAMDTKTKQSQAYSFMVHRDPNPKGREWLRRVMRQPT